MGSEEMRSTIVFILGLAIVLAFLPAAEAQKIQLGKEPGTEVPEVTAGPGWKTCVNCQNNGHVAAARDKYKVVGHPFDAHDITGMWTSAPDTPTGGYGG